MLPVFGSKKLLKIEQKERHLRDSVLHENMLASNLQAMLPRYIEQTVIFVFNTWRQSVLYKQPQVANQVSSHTNVLVFEAAMLLADNLVVKAHGI